MLGKWVAFCTRTCLHRLGSTPPEAKKTKQLTLHSLLKASRHLWMKNRVSDVWQVCLFFFY